MRRLLLIRHAKTKKESPTGKDRDRRLDERGLRDAEEMGLYLAQQDLLPDVALVSTAVRAQQTWECLSDTWQNIQPKIREHHLDDLYDADPGDLLRVVRATAEDPQRLAVIAHNPGLHEFALALVASGNVEARQILLENLPTTGVVVIDFTIDDWQHVSFRRGRLEYFVSPRLLKEASGRE